MLVGLVQVVDPGDITAIVNVGDDCDLHGLRICPDLDTITYTVSGSVNPETGWGLAGETWAAKTALERFADVRPAGSAAGSTWFGLGDRDLATHLYRTGRTAEGAPLSTVSAEIARAFGLGFRLVPVTDDRLRTMITLDGEVDPLDFQQWFVGRRHQGRVTHIRFVGASAAHPAPGVIDAIAGADVLVICPSNPVVSIDPVLAVPGVRDAVVAARRRCVAISPIIGGAALKGPAADLLRDLGHEVSVVGVARLYAPLAATLVIDEIDADLSQAVEAAGMHCIVASAVMHDAAAAGALARVVLARSA